MKVRLALGRKTQSSMRWRRKDAMSPREGNHLGAAAFVSSHSFPSPGRCRVGPARAQQRRGPGCAQGAGCILVSTGAAYGCEGETMDPETGRRHPTAWGEGLPRHLDTEQGRTQGKWYRNPASTHPAPSFPGPLPSPRCSLPPPPAPKSPLGCPEPDTRNYPRDHRDLLKERA